MNKKSQAALEFLTTYAWAFLVILIMVGALAYFGILRPQKVLPDRCNFGVAVGCIDYNVQYNLGTDGTVTMRLKNGVGEPVTVTAVTLNKEDGTAAPCTYVTPVLGTGWSWGTGVIQNFDWNACNMATMGFLTGEKSKFNIIIDYYITRSGSSFTRRVEGEIFTAVAP